MSKAIIHHTPKMKWEKLQEFPGPADVKIVREDPSLGAKTMLVQIPAGGRITPHSHRGIVQHFVLEGQYETEGEFCEPGSYRMMPAHGDVSPITTKEGVTILMIYDPVSN
ncbi:MAG: hypothetical protein NPIRA03_26500 [Nitrospirales bacterium]|nr:MAG: hypothetical protein NPIRA03_26500 [Nitrospirales bacterium]